MSTIITEQYEHWCANQIISGKPARPDIFVFAYVPEQDESAEIPRDETLPDESMIQYRAPVTQYGLLSPNATAFSIILDTTIGDFEYNWIGLLNEESGVLCMIAHTPRQQKIKTANGVQGNNLIRTFSMEFDGAASAMHIDVGADVWQIDFTARLAGMDEARRLLALDHYGEAAFLGDGFQVSYQDGTATVAAGVGYVGGLRVSLGEPYSLPAAVGDTIWIDASWQGVVTGEWRTVFTLSARTEHASYTDENGFRHFVAPLGSVTEREPEDLRPQTPDEQMNDALAEHEKSRRHPDATLTEKGFTQLCSATDSDSEELSATPKAVKAAYDNAEGRLEKDRNGNDIPEKDTFVRNIGAARAFSGSVNIGGDNGDWTTAQFIDWLESQGALDHPYWMCKGSWSYASNKIITDTGCGNIQLAGAVVEVMGVKSAMTIRITTPTTVTNGTPRTQFTYINHGDSYAPGWRRTGDAVTSVGRVTAMSDTERGTATGLQMYEAYNNGYPATYGNVLHLKGSSAAGEGELFIGWSGTSGAHAPVCVRSRRDTDSATWSEWAQFYTTANKPTASDVDAYSKSESDARYLQSSAGIQDIRLGSATNIGRGGDAPSGHLVSGVDGGQTVSWVNARPVQVLIDGTWRNVVSL